MSIVRMAYSIFLGYSLVNLFRLLDPRYFLLPLLGSKFPLEVAIGINGRVWIKTPEIKQTIAVARCIEAVDPGTNGDMDRSRLEAFLQNMDI